MVSDGPDLTDPTDPESPLKESLLKEYDVEEHGIVTYRVKCYNSTSHGVYVFALYNGRALRSATYLQAGTSGRLQTAKQPYAKGQEKASRRVYDENDRHQSTGIVEIRFYDPSEGMPVPSFEPDTIYPDHVAILAREKTPFEKQWLPTPEQWANPHKVIRFVYTGKGGYANIDQKRKDIMARARVFRPPSSHEFVLPPIAALSSPVVAKEPTTISQDVVNFCEFVGFVWQRAEQEQALAMGLAEAEAIPENHGADDAAMDVN
ncbi:hypothetical protein EVJ58_g7388 [Rhodofomes roseus]|uniref:Uncharacterized protein n=1 Tax=Rhodofomes roseus TaxID=34475 RepID=A0A4Y9Y3A4_9APHY|nr:hypothetical protein EVJ58_g7388 [Rhodofomes roseus]